MTERIGHVDWSPSETFSLIKCVRQYEPLWSIGQPTGNKIYRKNAWQQIAAKFADPLKKNPNVVKSKWKALQNQFWGKPFSCFYRCCWCFCWSMV